MMTDYLLMVREDERAHAAQSPRAMAELIVAHARFADELRRADQLRDAGRFRPSAEGKRVRRRGDRLRVEDGALAADGRSVAAYYWVAAASADDAGRLAARVPTLPADAIDVRTLVKGIVVPDKDARPGKVFAFVVIGAADSEAAWVEVMDRIDAETQDGFPAEAFLGGNRLQPPRRATVDGPFLESKEVIGGVFFLRMHGMDDAVRWAAASRFVVHGALEIRELWRS
jgi:hypothetical protein